MHRGAQPHAGQSPPGQRLYASPGLTRGQEAITPAHHPVQSFTQANKTLVRSTGQAFWPRRAYLRRGHLAATHACHIVRGHPAPLHGCARVAAKGLLPLGRSHVPVADFAPQEPWCLHPCQDHAMARATQPARICEGYDKPV